MIKVLPSTTVYIEHTVRNPKNIKYKGYYRIQGGTPIAFELTYNKRTKAANFTTKLEGNVSDVILIKQILEKAAE